MPLYRYICNDCSMEFELLQSHFDDPAQCPGCGSKNNKRLLNRIGGIKNSGAGECSKLADCPSAAGGHCCCGGNCHHSH